jgi:hypothetical protein
MYIFYCMQARQTAVALDQNMLMGGIPFFATTVFRSLETGYRAGVISIPFVESLRCFATTKEQRYRRSFNARA